MVGIKTIELDDTRAGIVFAKPESVKKAIVKAVKKLDTLVASPTSSKGWTASLGRMTFSNDNIKYDNNAQGPAAKGLDFAHMDIRGLNAGFDNLAYNPETISGKVNSFSFNEKSGLIVKKFHTSFFYGPKSAYLKDLYLETPLTIIQKQLQVSRFGIEPRAFYRSS